MNSTETARAALSLMRKLFPAYFRDMSRDEGVKMLEAWSEQLKGVPEDSVLDAIYRISKKQRYAPYIPEVFAELRDRLEVADAKIAMHDSWTSHGIESPYTEEQIAEERRISAALSEVLIKPKAGGD